MRTYLIDYPWCDGTYVMPVKADSPSEAMERLRQAANHGRCSTPHGAEQIAINARWYANLIIWVRNVFARP